MALLDLLTFAVACWLGLYLLVRNPSKVLLRRAAYGLLAYALALTAIRLGQLADAPLATTLARLHNTLVLLPALCWSGTLLLLLPEASTLRPRLDYGWRYGLVPITLLAILLREAGYLPWVAWLVALLVLLPLAAGTIMIAWQARRPDQPQGMGLLAVALLFFGLGTSLLFFPLNWLPYPLALTVLGVDLVLLGLVIALLDAFAEGETLRLDITRSAAAAGIAALALGAPLATALQLNAGPPLLLTALLFTSVAMAIALQTFADPLAALLDRLIFAHRPQLQQQREMLREVASALPRAQPDLTLDQLDEATFTRLVRRALSHYGDLAHLAVSPLTQLPVISARLAARQAPDDALERATELKHLLAEGIVRLKPRNGEQFGTSDEWRYYNALYFPYVIGLKPYNQRSTNADLDPVAQEALNWLRTMVPERTLYNWQNAAARLLAQDLRQKT